jgi:molybdopterin biosynthesis enzyme
MASAATFGASALAGAAALTAAVAGANAMAKIPGFAQGGSFTVPATGQIGDSYPILLKPREHIDVTTGSKTTMIEQTVEMLGRKFDILSANIVEGRLRTDAGQDNELYGSFDGRDMYITNVKNGKVLSRLRG